MSIKYVSNGNLLKANTSAVVNTVNCVGIMGKGLALQFKLAFPDNFLAYSKACKAKQVRVGKMFVFDTKKLSNPHFIINFPTKEHWHNPSNLDWIQEGLEDLVNVIKNHSIKSIAIPPLGCGLGGLRWNQVQPLIDRYLNKLSDIDVLVYSPK